MDFQVPLSKPSEVSIEGKHSKQGLGHKRSKDASLTMKFIMYSLAGLSPYPLLTTAAVLWVESRCVQPVRVT